MNPWNKALTAAAALLLGAGLTACEKDDPRLVQGYVEGEFVYVASPGTGQLMKLSVERGAQVERGAPLFALDDAPEKVARDEAMRRVEQAKATLEDVKKGLRPTEVAALQAQLEQAQAALKLSKVELERQTKLKGTGAGVQRDFDAARSEVHQNEQRVLQLNANLETAKLGSREQQITALEQALLAQQAVLAGVEWRLGQKSQAAPVAGLVSDVVFRQGDWVAAGAPVVVLLPPGNVKVRAFVPQQIVGQIHTGDKAKVHIDGVTSDAEGKVSYIAPRAEYTPPVIYSQRMREKLVFLVELTFATEVAAKLHPGQPVDVRFPNP